MKHLHIILKMSRPTFWLYLAGPYIVSISYLYKQNVQLNFLSIIWLLFFLFPANFFMYSINDYFDQDTDAINPKKTKKEIAYPLNYHQSIVTLNILIILFSVILCLSLHSVTSQLVFVTFIVLVYFYSAPPLAFKRRPFLDSISNFFYFLPGIIPFVEQKIHISYILIIAALSWTTAMHLFSAIPDITYDKKAQIWTTATMLGEQKSLILCIVLWLIFASITTFFAPLLFITFIYPSIVLLLLLHKRISVEKIYWSFPYFNTMVGFSIFLYIVLKV